MVNYAAQLAKPVVTSFAQPHKRVQARNSFAGRATSLNRGDLNFRTPPYGDHTQLLSVTKSFERNGEFQNEIFPFLDWKSHLLPSNNVERSSQSRRHEISEFLRFNIYLVFIRRTRQLFFLKIGHHRRRRREMELNPNKIHVSEGQSIFTINILKILDTFKIKTLSLV